MTTSNPSIAVIGTCQSTAIARSLQAMLPASKVRCSREKDVTVAQLLTSSQIVFTQANMIKSVSATRKALGVRPLIIFFPEVYITSFHPDLIQARCDGQVFRSMFGSNNSAICLWGWKNGLTEAQTLSLFHEDVYAHLGYFDHAAISRADFKRNANMWDMDLTAEYARWEASGNFMHCSNHPKLTVVADIARALLAKAGVTPQIKHPEAYGMIDLLSFFVWAFYPAIAREMGLQGEYVFYNGHAPVDDRGRKKKIITLEEFVEGSYQAYKGFKPGKVAAVRLDDPRYADLGAFIRRPRAKSAVVAPNPYKGLPDHRFWSRSVAKVAPDRVDPVVRTSFKITPDMQVATAGSCFAQHIARTLSRSGYNYFVPEAGEALGETARKRRNFGVFSARYGNLYTTRQLLQLFDRAYGAFTPQDTHWPDGSGGFVDPFRPQIEPDGFDSVEALEASRAEHFAFVRQMFETLDVFVFTLGLTESWESTLDGAVYPVAPGVSGGAMDPALHRFVNYTAGQVSADLAAFIERLRGVNPAAKIILTVSPVPLIATYEDAHVLVSTTYSKSALRVAAETVSRAFDGVDYFPSYEIITGGFNRGAYFEADLRSVTEDGVAHVMRTFLRHYSDAKVAVPAPSPVRIAPAAAASALEAELAEGRRVVCDEEAIESAAAE
jgi:hypothetical protein